MIEGNSNRRWFRFGLRTMFVVVTLVGLWLGYYLHWISARQEARLWIATHFIGGSFGYQAKDPSAFPLMLKVLGEKPEPLILMNHQPTQVLWLGSPYQYDALDQYHVLLRRVESLFPEAVVMDVTPDRPERPAAR